MHALGKDLEAIALAADALRFGRKIKGVTNIYFAFLTMALMAFDRGQETKGRACLRKAFALGREGGFYGNWGIHPDDLARLCSKALEYGIEVEYAQEYIRRYHLKPAPQPVQSEHWPWPLKVFTLGQFLVLKDGQPLRFSRKVQQKPLDLLKALVAAGAKGIRDEDLAKEFCRGLMVCCQNLDLKSEGLSAYKIFEKRLKTELGIEPAGKTRAIRDGLLGKGK